jgi:hypothetical protein
MSFDCARDNAVSFELLAIALLLIAGPSDVHAQQAEDSLKYLGNTVRLITPKQDEYGSPKGPASVCVDVTPRARCYSAPQAFGVNPTATIVQLTARETAILFSAHTLGVSGWTVKFALLRPGENEKLDNLFLSDVSVSNQSQHAFWDETTVSTSKIFLTADFTWGPDESHYSAHPYMISAYRRKEPLFAGDDDSYYLQDRYMTARKYDFDSNPKLDILASEKQEIIARLKRAKAEELRRRAGQRMCIGRRPFAANCGRGVRDLILDNDMGVFARQQTPQASVRAALGASRGRLVA